MDVPVLHKRGQRRLRSATRTTILGDGLLERVRSTSLALLGLTAAVGLAMVALALNQGWPLIAGAPIPGFGERHAAIDDAAVAAEANAPGGRGPALGGGTAGRPDSQSLTPPARPGAGGTPAPVGPRAPGSESIVVSDSTPTGPAPADGPPGGASPSPPSADQQPAVTPVPAAPPAPAPAATPPAQAPVASVSTPPPSSAGTPPPGSPEEVDDDDDGVDEDCPPDEEQDEDEDRDHSHGWHRGYGHGHW
jgi:hypothetical protein